MTSPTLVTRQMMIEEVSKRVSERKETYNNTKSNSFSEWGAHTRLTLAEGLLTRLENDITPSVHEVVAYFGKGSRFSESA